MILISFYDFFCLLMKDDLVSFIDLQSLSLNAFDFVY